MLLFIRQHGSRRLYSRSAIACAEFLEIRAPERALYPSTESAYASYLLQANSRLKELVKTGHLKDARELFDKMLQRDEISWTSLISGYVNAKDCEEALYLFTRMRLQPSLKMDPFIFSLVLKACAVYSNMNYGELIHSCSVKTGLINSVFVGSALLDMYAKTGKIWDCCQVFDELPLRNVVSWTAIITGLVNAGYNGKGLLYFSEMWKCKVQCDSYTFAIALKACADSCNLDHGREIHTQTIKKGFDLSSYVANTLATMYNKCGKLDYGLCLFRKMRSPDVVSWTTFITTYVRMGKGEVAFWEFMRMRESDVRPNEYTLAAVICGCANLGVIEWGEQLHAHVTRLGLMDSLSVANSIMTMYAKCGQLNSASQVFNVMVRRDIVSWSTVISGHSQSGYGEEAFRLLSWMRRERTEPTEFAVSSVLSVCGNMAILEQGRQLHAYVQKTGLEHTSMTRSALINMYSKCGSIKEASQIFNAVTNNDIVSWTAMINGYAEHGHSQEAIEIFQKIPQAGLKPDSITFIGVLTACSHAGLVDLGFHFFNSMASNYHINPSKEHYGCMIDLLCRAGRLTEAEDMINSMPYEQDEVVWSTLLRACRVHGNVECGRRTAEMILRLNPNCAGTHITLANIYSVKGKWWEAAEVRKMMKSKGVTKEPGSSWIKVKDLVTAFVSGDKSHPQCEYLYSVVDLLAAGTDVSPEDIEILLCDAQD
ncbi:hypothetical protein Nepgr_024348 [Nepenthes gracilis]|uniref:Pentatricopeptide repeat-containing protein n=1 Tax=Nepenthes gracilis TaxID=150966 RepID=A0AAD3T2X7_NEPGR|nr:hypothetical protein Nepgr_024348 [Nepenthes gracilis]